VPSHTLPTPTAALPPRPPPVSQHAQAQQASASLSGAGGYRATRSLAGEKIDALSVRQSSSRRPPRPPPVPPP
jgi:hypothetical protein